MIVFSSTKDISQDNANEYLSYIANKMKNLTLQESMALKNKIDSLEKIKPTNILDRLDEHYPKEQEVYELLKELKKSEIKVISNFINQQD